MDFLIEDQDQQPAMIEREIVPAGVHEMTIRHAEEGPNHYKACDGNPDGLCLKLRLATTSGNYKFVFDDIPKHLGWRAKQLAEAIGVSAAGGMVSLDPQLIVGATLTVEVSHYESKVGKVSAVVKKYVPSGQRPAIRKAKPRPAVTRAAGGDDIPF